MLNPCAPRDDKTNTSPRSASTLLLGEGGKTRSVLKFRWGLNDPIIRCTRFEMGSGVGTVVGSVDPIIRCTRFEMGSGVGTVVGSVVGTVVKL